MRKLMARVIPFMPLGFLLAIPYTISLMKESLMEEEIEEEEEDNFIKVAVVEDRAYWVVNNTLYEAEVVDGEIMKEDAEPINAFDLNFNDVNRIMNILDNMQDWKN
jgi:hypothetical protein